MRRSVRCRLTVLAALTPWCATGCGDVGGHASSRERPRLVASIAAASAVVDARRARSDSAIAAFMHAPSDEQMGRHGIDARWPTLILYGGASDSANRERWQRAVTARAESAGWLVIQALDAPRRIVSAEIEVVRELDRDTLPRVGGVPVVRGVPQQALAQPLLERCDLVCLHALRGDEAEVRRRS